MLRKCFSVLLITIITAGAAFAQESENSGAKNTITVDIGPTIVSLTAVGILKSMLPPEGGFSPTGFGIGVQYERQIINKFAVAGHLAYFGFGLQYSDTFLDQGVNITTRADVNLYAITAEALARYYPFEGTFFLCGILGYTNMGINASGQIKGSAGGVTEAVSANYTISRHFIKFGAKLGWRIRSGKSNGGFTFEPSLGWDFGFSASDTFGKQLEDKISSETGEETSLEGMDFLFSLVENFLFVGGPRATLSFGWSF